MNLWVFNHYAESPDGSATRTFELCRALTDRGHDVTIFASSFSHYRLREEHFTKGWQWSKVEVRDKVRFIWLRGFPYRTNDWRRITNMIEYGALALFRSLATQPKPDVIIGCSVHPCAALAGLAIARLTHRPFFVEMPDLWPQVLIDFGRIRSNSMQARVLRQIETVLFRAAERVIMLWRDTDGYVRSRGLDPDKILWIPHVIDPSHYPQLPECTEHGPPFIAMYVGSFVQSMALDVVLDAAQLLWQHGRQDIRVVMIGDGSDKKRLLSRARNLHLSNLEIREPIPKSEVPGVLAEADCLICCFKSSPVYQYGLSMSKLCDYLMSGRPVVFAGESSYNPVAEAGAGIAVRGEDPEALARAIETIVDLRCKVRRAMGQRGVAWVKNYHDVRLLADRLEAVLLRGRGREGGAQ